jgi:hypothetical protein
MVKHRISAGVNRYTPNPVTGLFERDQERYIVDEFRRVSQALLGTDSITQTLKENVIVKNGFEETDSGALSFDEGSRTLTLSADGGLLTFWSGGNKFSRKEDLTLTISDVEGLHYVYLDSRGELQEVTTFDFEDLIQDSALVSAIYWDATNNEAVIFADERHLRMDPTVHGYLHTVFNTQWVSGLGLGNLVVGQNGDDAEDAQFSVESGVIRDEDLILSIVNGAPQTLSPIAEVPVLYRTGANGDWRKVDATQFPVTTAGSGRAAWNEFTGGVWQLSEVSNNDFFCMHIFATGDLRHPIVAIMGQDEYATRGLAEAGAEVELKNLRYGPLTELTPENKPLGTILFQTGDGKDNAVKSSVEETEDGSDYIDWRTSFVGGSGTSTGAVNHPDTLNRDLADQHPISAITSLQTELDNRYTETETDTLLDAKFDVAGGTITGNVTIKKTGPLVYLYEESSLSRHQFYASGGNFYIQAGALGQNWTASSGNIRFAGFANADVGQFTVRYGGADRIIWHAGNDGAGSGLDADTVDGVQPSTDGTTTSTIAQRDSAGDVHSRLFRTNYPVQSSGVPYPFEMFYRADSSNNYIRPIGANLVKDALYASAGNGSINKIAAMGVVVFHTNNTFTHYVYWGVGSSVGYVSLGRGRIYFNHAQSSYLVFTQSRGATYRAWSTNRQLSYFDLQLFNDTTGAAMNGGTIDYIVVLNGAAYPTT